MHGQGGRLTSKPLPWLTATAVTLCRNRVSQCYRELHSRRGAGDSRIGACPPPPPLLPRYESAGHRENCWVSRTGKKVMAANVSMLRINIIHNHNDLVRMIQTTLLEDHRLCILRQPAGTATST